MKVEIDNPTKIEPWLASPQPAVFQGQDLRAHSTQMAKSSLRDCTFLGCQMKPVLSKAAAAAGCLIIPRMSDLRFDPFTYGLYTPAELYDRFDPDDPATYHACLDWLVYDSYIDPETTKLRDVDADVIVMRRLHDASISDALGDLLDLQTRRRCVAIVGGHDMPRGSDGIYRDIATLALKLSAGGYMILTGGGPGLMEAANLGAYAAGFTDPDTILQQTLTRLKDAPTYKDVNWLSAGYRAWKAMGPPAAPQKSRNIGIPTWFYGFEPPNVFATDIAKYFENSIREEGLLAVALGGVLVAQGNAGTVQEIFQDACQNYYKTYEEVQSPMILFGKDYWNPPEMVLDDAKDKRKKVYPLLEKLAAEKSFSDYLLITDDVKEVVDFIRAHPPRNKNAPEP